MADSMEKLARALRSPGTRSVSEDEVEFGVNPLDELRRTVNTRRFTPEQAAQNRAETGWEVLSNIPGPGNVISAYDAYTGSQDAAGAASEGDYKGAAISGSLAGLSALGAVLGLPVGKFAKGAADAGKDALYAIPAWHGSPHDFDEFKLDKIGTGEGAQAYGHGLYFAESPGVAKHYQKVLGQQQNPHAASSLYDIDQTVQWLRSGRQGPKPAKADQYVGDASSDLQSDYIKGPFANPTDEQIAEHLAGSSAPRGRLYRTELDVEPEDLLDWDAPLSQQSEKVRQAIGRLPEGKALFEQEALVSQIERRLAELKAQRMTPEVNAEGAALSRQLLQERQKLGTLEAHFEDYKTLTSSPAASNALREAGIPGIRYLDQGSRGAGEGSRNFVIFDDSLVKILGKE